MRFSSVVLALGLCLAGPVAAQRPEQAPGTIRSSVTIVPLDVRVLDSRGNPVTDLTREDFTVLEDGVPQTIGHFSTHGLTADLNLAKAGPLRPGRAPEGIEPANRRVFLLMLGRGRHEDVTRSISALEAFISERLLPQDQVALLAWNRATEFTTDHARIREIVRRYRERHAGIDLGMQEWFNEARVSYGSREIPAALQARIDAVVAGGTAPVRALEPGQTPDDRGVASTMRRNARDIQGRELEDGRAFPDKMIADPFERERSAMLGLSFDAYVTQSGITMQDLGALYAGIDYLRFLDGEKHLVFFTAQGLRLPRAEDAVAVGRVAANARITIDAVHTGGTAAAGTSAAPPMTEFFSKGMIRMTPIVTSAEGAQQSFSVRELSYIAEATGGRLSAFTNGDVALERIDRQSRFQYLLGYTPGNGTTDGRFRKVEVTVRRPGMTVLSRQGYFATRQPVGLDKQRLKTAWRMLSAAEYQDPIEELKLTLQAPRATATPAGARVALQITVPIARLAPVDADGPARAQLELALFFADVNERVVHEVWESVTLPLTPEVRQRYLAGGAPLTLGIDTPAGVRFVKVVVYDSGSDLVGSAASRVR